MMDDWNKVHIPEPPVYTEEYIKEDHDDIDLNECVRSLHHALSSWSPWKPKEYFFIEVKILGALLHGHKKLRAMKFYGHFTKIFKCTKRLQKITLYNYVELLRGMMEDCSLECRSVRLPTRKMFEYLLIRIFGVVKLLLTIETQCCKASKILLDIIKIGHGYHARIPLLAVAARLRVLALDIAGQFTSVYDGILPWLPYLKDGSKSSFFDGNPICLLDELKSHCKRTDVEPDSKLTRKTPSLEASSILNIFNNKVEDSDFEGDEFPDDFVGDDFPDDEIKPNFLERFTEVENEAITSVDGSSISEAKKTKSTTGNKVKKIRKLKEKEDKAMTSADGSVASVTKKRKSTSGHEKVKKCRQLKEKGDVLSLLDLLDDAEHAGKDAKKVGISRKGSKVSNDTIPDLSNVANSILFCEDLGETV